MAAFAAWAIAVVLHLGITKAHDLVVAAIFDQHGELLGVARCSLGLVVPGKHLAGITDLCH